MIGLGLWVLNLVIWVWFIGFLCSIPLLTRYILRTEDSVKIGDFIFGFANCFIWFFCLVEITQELEDAFDFDFEEVFNKIMDYELFKFKKS